MGVVNRQFVYKRRIKVSSDDLVMARNGKKTCTIRLGTASVDGELMDLSDGQNELKVRIVSVETEPYRNLTLQHAQWEGFSTVEELQKDLEKYYRRIDQDQLVTIIRFEPVSAT
jgi:hypothetical protein